MKEFLTSNTAEARLIRTIVQGVLGVLVSNLDLFIGYISIDPALKPVIVAAVMAVLSPIMAHMGGDADA